MKRLTSVGLRRARSRKHRRGHEDLVRTPQLIDLLAQLLDLLALRGGRQIRPQALIGLDPAHVLAQRLRGHTEITRDVRDRPARLEHHTRAAIKQLRRILASAGHQPILPQDVSSCPRGLSQTQPGSFHVLRQLGPAALERVPTR
jgi:hypothetical protein